MHEQFVKLAKRLIKANGRQLKLVTPVEGAEEWSASTYSEENAQDVIAVQTKFSNNEIDGSLVTTLDIKFIVDSSVEPVNTMQLWDIKDGIVISKYSIINVKTVAPGETDIIYMIQARL